MLLLSAVVGLYRAQLILHRSQLRVYLSWCRCVRDQRYNDAYMCVWVHDNDFETKNIFHTKLQTVLWPDWRSLHADAIASFAYYAIWPLFGPFEWCWVCMCSAKLFVYVHRKMLFLSLCVSCAHQTSITFNKVYVVCFWANIMKTKLLLKNSQICANECVVYTTSLSLISFDGGMYRSISTTGTNMCAIVYHTIYYININTYNVIHTYIREHTYTK